MIFRKNKPASAPGNDKPSMRGRDGDAAGDKPNPLARRFVPGDEPETIDLVGPAGFPSTAEESEPDTRVTTAEGAENVEPGRVEIVSRDPETGKFYVHAGTSETPVLLAGEPVAARTELRKGDRIRIGEAEFEFLL